MAKGFNEAAGIPRGRHTPTHARLLAIMPLQ